MLDRIATNLIRKLSEEETKLYIVEIGASVPVAYSLLNTPGASKVVYHSECPYGSAATKYGITKRMVSAEAVTQIVERIVEEYRAGSHGRGFNAILATSFQVRSGEGDVKIPHGWVAYATRQANGTWHTQTYHLTTVNLNGAALDRWSSINTIAEDVMAILAGSKQYNTVDIINGDPIAVLRESKSPLLTFRGGKPVRFEDVSREGQLILYKGSFNPIHEGHCKIADHMKNLDPMYRVVFGISRNTYEKGEIGNEALYSRIKAINDAGYDACVFDVGYFFNNVNMLIDRMNKPVYLALGTDTFNRLLKCYYIKDFSPQERDNIGRGDYFTVPNLYETNRKANFHKNFGKTKFYVFGRGNEPIYENELEPNFEFIDFDCPISSTMLREANNQTKERT